MANLIRHNWKAEEIQSLLTAPLFQLIDRARSIHKQYHNQDIQLASLLSIKTGGCPEDCKYCPQSAHFEVGRKNREDLMEVDEVLKKARLAKKMGAGRFCMGAAWRSVKEGKEFDRVLQMVGGVRRLGMEACVTLGMLSSSQAKRLKQAGLTAYNHNLDSSPEFYKKIITTRKFEDRLATLQACREQDLQLCSGGIIGMGETIKDRAEMLKCLASFNPHPESVPINALEPVEGTPLGDAILGGKEAYGDAMGGNAMGGEASGGDASSGDAVLAGDEPNGNGARGNGARGNGAKENGAKGNKLGNGEANGNGANGANTTSLGSHNGSVDPLELVRMCAAARITMPKARVRLSAGRSRLSKEAQTLCFLAGANSVFYGEKLLTTPNSDCDQDKELLAQLGLDAPSTSESTTSE